MNYYELLRDWGHRQEDKLLLAEDGRTICYGEMLRIVEGMRKQWSEKFPQRHQHGSLLVLADTLGGQLAAFLALQAMDIRPILLHHGLKTAETAAILQENQLQGILTVRQTTLDPSNIDQSAFDWSIEATDYAGQTPQDEDILGVLSSGSTGVPKVMYRTYASWAGFFPVQNAIFHIQRETRLFIHGSLSFTGNLNALLGVLYAGGSIITSGTWHCRQWAALMQAYAVDVIYLLPTKLQVLVAALKAPLPQVQCLFTGSQLLSSRNIRDLKKLFPKAELILYYGASELNYITYAICGHEKRDSRNLGRPFPGIGLSVRNGLIYVDTPYHVSGMKPPFTVKDTGWLNAAGELIFEGRQEAWINKGGVKLNTLRLENELREVPGVQEAVVLSMQDKLRGSSAAAYVVKAAGISEKEVRQAIRRTLKPVEIPQRISFLPKLPLNDRGKVDRKRLEMNHCQLFQTSGA